MDKVYNEIIDRMKKESFYLSDDLDIDIEVVTLEDAKKIVDEVLNDKYEVDKYIYKAIDDFVENISLEISESIIWGMLVNSHKDNSFNDTSEKIVDYVIDTIKEVAEQLKAGVENE